MRTSFLRENSFYFITLLSFWLAGAIVYLQIEKGELVLYLMNHRTAFWNVFFSWGTRLGEGYLFLFFFLVLLFVRFSNAFMIGVTGLTVLFTSKALKYFFDEARPSIYFAELADPTVILEPVPGEILVQSWTSSYPSGHTMAAFALYGMLAFSFKSQATKFIALTIAIVVGISRIYLGQHFLPDVLAGALCGTLIAVGLFFLQGQLSRWPLARQSLLDYYLRMGKQRNSS